MQLNLEMLESFSLKNSVFLIFTDITKVNSWRLLQIDF